MILKVGKNCLKEALKTRSDYCHVFIGLVHYKESLRECSTLPSVFTSDEICEKRGHVESVKTDQE